MNLVRFNIPLLPAINHRPEVMHSPLLVWSAPPDAEMNIASTPWIINGNGSLRLPFDFFRAEVSLPPQSVVESSGKKSQGNKVWKIRLAVDRPPFSDGEKQDLCTSVCASWEAMPNRIYVYSLGVMNERPVYKMEFVIEDGVTYKPSAFRITEEQAEESFAWFFLLLADFLNPAFHLAKCHPRIPSGKSAQWIQQRTHYVLLHKSHPVNSRTATGKENMDPSDQIWRSAHSRRAHFRLLKSERFTKLRGQRRFVRSTWVGPKEWIDRSGQVYKIVNRSDFLRS